MSQSAFERLFTTNVPHVLEKIFFSLDYETFKACREVCKAWKGLISSDAYTKIENTVLTENHERLKKAVKERNVEVLLSILIELPWVNVTIADIDKWMDTRY